MSKLFRAIALLSNQSVLNDLFLDKMIILIFHDNQTHQLWTCVVKRSKALAFYGCWLALPKQKC